MDDDGRRRMPEETEAWIEGHPVGLQPLARRVLEARSAAVEAITARNRVRASGAPLAELEVRAGATRQACEDLEREFSDAVLEHRVSEFEPGKREQARAILVAAEEAVAAVHADPTIDAGEFGAKGGILFGLQFRHRRAVEAGDEVAVASLVDLMATAQVEVDAARVLMAEDRRRIEEIRAECERRLALL